MKLFISLFLLLTLIFKADAQKMYSSNAGQVKLKVNSKVENIIAQNDQAESRWLESNGQLFFSVLINNFKSENSILETELKNLFTEMGKFPKATFKGFIEDIQHIDLSNSGGNEFYADGVLTIHGITQNISITGNLTVLSSGKIMLNSDLKIRWADFNINTKKMSSKLAPESLISIYCLYE